MNILHAQTKINVVDLQKYSGKWYVIATIPTLFDKNWDYTTESYHVNKDGTIAIFTTYRKNGKEKTHSVKSKGFPNKTTNNLTWKVQFVWPFKADYLIEELADDYSYVVVGHPKKKFLYIMNRTGKINEIKYNETLKRYQQKGYDISKLKKLNQSI
jgi:apolipoprotein D and lipocalin family protein